MSTSRQGPVVEFRDHVSHLSYRKLAWARARACTCWNWSGIRRECTPRGAACSTECASLLDLVEVSIASQQAYGQRLLMLLLRGLKMDAAIPILLSHPIAVSKQARGKRGRRHIACESRKSNGCSLFAVLQKMLAFSATFWRSITAIALFYLW